MITAPPEPGRFTIDGSEALETFLQESCNHVLCEVRKIIPSQKLEGLLLAGGYGRGEGGVYCKQIRVTVLYNDLDFYVFLRGNYLVNARGFGSRLHHLGEELSHQTGIEIELKADSLSRWRRSQVTMFSYDVLMGHKWVSGDESLFRGCEHHRRADRIPPSEAARLLLNRCSGLLFAAEHLERKEFTPEAADFVVRNIAKAQLGLGDACLAMLGQYHWSCLERRKRLQQLDVSVDLKTHHAAGVEFKLHPKLANDSRAELQRAHAETAALAQKTWLWLESQRLNTCFASPAHYARDRRNKCPESPRWRNSLINLRTFGPKKCFSRDCLRYPRERLFRSLPLLLWERNDSTSLLRTTLGTDATDFTTFVQAYSTLWRRFN